MMYFDYLHLMLYIDLALIAWCFAVPAYTCAWGADSLRALLAWWRGLWGSGGFEVTITFRGVWA